MKSLKFLVTLALVLGVTQAYSEETKSEKATDEVHDVKREAKAKKHHVQEKMCADSDAECLAKKAGNRTTEAKDATKDKASEVKNKIDGN